MSSPWSDKKERYSQHQALLLCGGSTRASTACSPAVGVCDEREVDLVPRVRLDVSDPPLRKRKSAVFRMRESERTNVQGVLNEADPRMHSFVFRAVHRRIPAGTPCPVRLLSHTGT